MKLIIGYDGSPTAEAALDDLGLAGLPEHGEAFVLTVEEVWLQHQNFAPAYPVSDLQLDPYAMAQVRKHWDQGRRMVGEAETLVHHALNRFDLKFPFWTTKAGTAHGSAPREILSRAEALDADLIVVGCQGRAAAARHFLGSISQKVLTEARCSVRIARGRNQAPATGTRLVIGFDGSAGAEAAVETVAARQWREGTKVRLIAVTDPVTPSAIGRFVLPIVNWAADADRSQREYLEKMSAGALRKLRDAGLQTRLTILSGNPKLQLVGEAASWGADAIFVGANSLGTRRKKHLLGSVTAAVAARAHCSVEAVRRNF